MSKQFQCPNCQSENATRFLSPGEVATCRVCGRSIVIPEGTEKVSQAEYDRWLATAKTGSAKTALAGAVTGMEAPDATENPGTDTFGMKKAFITHQAIGMAWPLMILVVAAVVAGSQYMKISDKGPLIIAGAVLWLIWDIMKVSKASGYKLKLSDTGIQIGEVVKRWDEIEAAEYRTAYGMKPGVILNCADGTKLEIPTSLENVNYVISQVKAHVPQADG